jgi:hypothetical protein
VCVCVSDCMCVGVIRKHLLLKRLLKSLCPGIFTIITTLDRKTYKGAKETYKKAKETFKKAIIFTIITALDRKT